VYAKVGRPSIAPEKLLRALLLQVLCTVRSERLLIEQLDYNLLFRWFVGLNLDEEVWDASTVAAGRHPGGFFPSSVGTSQLLSDEHFTVDGTLLEAWASHKSFRPIEELEKKDKNAATAPRSPSPPRLRPV